MIKITGTALVAAAMLISSGAFAGEKTGDKACCVKGVSNTTEKTACADLTTLNLTADQKTKIEAWQAECMKDGCTKESRHKFFQQAKGILSADQFAKLKAECKKAAGAKEAKTET
jgi:hypothetical protein